MHKQAKIILYAPLNLTEYIHYYTRVGLHSHVCMGVFRDWGFPGCSPLLPNESVIRYAQNQWKNHPKYIDLTPKYVSGYIPAARTKQTVGLYVGLRTYIIIICRYTYRYIGTCISTFILSHIMCMH